MRRIERFEIAVYSMSYKRLPHSHRRYNFETIRLLMRNRLAKWRTVSIRYVLPSQSQCPNSSIMRTINLLVFSGYIFLYYVCVILQIIAEQKQRESINNSQTFPLRKSLPKSRRNSRKVRVRNELFGDETIANTLVRCVCVFLFNFSPLMRRWKRSKE